MRISLLVLAAFALRKLADARRSRRNVAALAASRRLVPGEDRTYRGFLVTHVAFFTLTPLEIVWLNPGFHPALGIPMALLFLAASLLRRWAIAHLSANWSSQVAVDADLAPATGGPYRYVRHPNYLAMSVELTALGLMLSAYASTLIVAVLNAVAVHARIREEEAALFQVPAYRDAMQSRARLIPGVY